MTEQQDAPISQQFNGTKRSRKKYDLLIVDIVKKLKITPPLCVDGINCSHIIGTILAKKKQNKKREANSVKRFIKYVQDIDNLINSD